MNPNQQALYHAKAYIDAGEVYYICYALGRVSRNHPELARAARAMINVVEDGLDVSGVCADTLGKWYDVLTGSTALYAEPFASLARMAWLDKLIEEHA